MNTNEYQYLFLLKELVDKAESSSKRSDRTGIGTYEKFYHTLDFNLSGNKIPLMTTKKINYIKVLEELYWFLILGNPDASYMKKVNNKIWDQWLVYNEQYPEGTIGPMYGQIIRKGKVDQLQEAIDVLRKNPSSRRSLFSSWRAEHTARDELSFEDNIKEGRGVLSPCHGLMNQLYLNENNKLEMFTYQRSQDVYIGACFNYAFYGTLAHLIARELNTEAVRLVYTTGCTHLYSNHIEQAKLQLTREPYQCPSIVIDKDIKKFDDWKDPSQISVINYQHHPFIKAPVAV